MGTQELSSVSTKEIAAAFYQIQNLIVPMIDWLDQCVNEGEAQTFPEEMLVQLKRLEGIVDHIPTGW